MSFEFQKKNDPEAERDRRASSASGAEGPGGSIPGFPGNPEAPAPESVNDPVEWPEEPVLERGESGDGDGLLETLPPAPLRRRRGRSLEKPPTTRKSLTPEQRLRILDAWKRSEYPGTEFSAIVGVS